MRTKIYTFVMCVLFLASPATCRSIILIDGSKIWQISGPEITTSFSLNVYVWENGNASSNLFSAVVDPYSVGTTFYATPSDPGFNQFVNWLTNSVSGTVVIGLTSLQTGSDWSGGVQKSELPNLQGVNVSGLSLKFDTLQLTTPGANYNHNGIWTDGNFGATLSTTPEPNTAVLLLVAFSVVLVFCRKRRHSSSKSASP